MLKLLHTKEKKAPEIKAALELPELDEELAELAAMLLSCDPSKFSKQKETFRLAFWDSVNALNAEAYVLPDEELDYAAGGTSTEKDFPKIE